MNIKEIPIDELQPYQNNAKKHPPEQIEKIAKSIELTKGLRQPIVIDSDNVIICGHGRYLAAKLLGYKSVPCELVTDLTDDEIKAYRLIDNKIQEGEYDLDMEFSELSEISVDIDMSKFGFDEFSIDDMNELDGYNAEKDEREFFTKTFTFPIEKKNQIICYLKKHQNEIIEQIIKDSENDD